MFEAIVATGESIAVNRSVRAVVLSGEGEGFCAGLDFEAFPHIKSDGLNLFEKKADGPYPNRFQNAACVWKRLPVPVIAALHGSAVGSGMHVALGADIRLASPDARFAIMEVKWGLVLVMAATQTLRDLVRLDVAEELLFTGRIVEAVEAHRLGLNTHVCDAPLVEALKMSNEIAQKSPDTILAGKSLLEEAWQSNSEEGLRLEEKLQKSFARFSESG